MTSKIDAVPRPNRVTLSLSDESLAVLDRYRRLMGISRGKLVDTWILEGIDTHNALLDQIEAVLVANKDNK